MKVYYVTGKNFLGQDVTERVMADTPADARKAAYKVASHATVRTPANAADRAAR